MPSTVLAGINAAKAEFSNLSKRMKMSANTLDPVWEICFDHEES